MNLATLLGGMLKADEPTHHPDTHITDFILKELLVFELKVKEERYYPTPSRWKSHEEFVSDIDKLITTFSLIRANEDNHSIYDNIEVQKGLLLFISMYRNLCFLESEEESNDKETTQN
jgi:hypothetical protein